MLKDKKITILIFSINFILIIISTYTNIIVAGDELWNYMNIRKIAQDITALYTEANVIITPIFHILSAAFIKIFGMDFIVFRIINIFIKLGLIISVYIIYKKFDDSENVAISLVTLFNMLFIYIDDGANYNELSLLFLFIGLIVYLSKNKGSLKNSILQGIIIYLIFFTKQNIGIYYIIANIVIDFIINKDKKIAFKELAVKGIVSGSLLIISLIIMYNIGIFNGFINYCFGGLSNFKQNFDGFDNILKNIQYILVTLGIISLTTIYLIKNNVKNKSKYIILLVISTICIAYIYPLFNLYHLVIGFSLSIIIGLVLIIQIFETINKKKIAIVLMVLSVWLLVLIIFINIRIYNKNGIKIYNGKVTCLNNSIITLTADNYIEETVSYLEEMKNNNKKVLMINLAGVYNYLYFNESNGFYDIPFVGNVGKLTEEELIENVKSMKETYIILVKDNKMFYQEFKNLNKYIKTSYNKVNELLDFEVYYIE